MSRDGCARSLGALRRLQPDMGPLRSLRSRLRPIRAAFDATQNMSPAAVAIERAIAPRVRALPATARVLDIGSGRGHSRASDVSGRYVCVDIEQRYRPDVVGDGTRLPFADGTFDAVCATSVLLVIEDPQTLFREVARVLRSGGVALLYAEFTMYACAAYGLGADLQRYPPGRLMRLAQVFRQFELVPVGGHHAYYANILWRYRARQRLGPLRPLLGVLYSIWASAAAPNPEAPLGFLVVGRA